MKKTRAQRRREERAKKKQDKKQSFEFEGWKIEIGPTFDNPIDAIKHMEELLEEPDAELIIFEEDLEKEKNDK